MVQTKLTKGHIFDIQGFSVHDGPGCRTLIFFKGCSLECAWCSNPEGISFFPEPLYRDSKCTMDGLCVNACPHKAIAVSENGEGEKLTFNRNFCSKCSTFDCIKACCSGALNLGGYEISVDDLYERINRDRQYWGSGGGITLTGGEPFAQPEFAAALLKRCYDAYIHTAVETCGNVPWENYKKSLPFLDWIFYDLKTLNESRFHDLILPSSCPSFDRSPSALRPPVRPSSALRPPSVRSSACPSVRPSSALRPPSVRLSACPPVPSSVCPPVTQILSNARRLAAEFTGRMVFRLPVIPGFNDDAENIMETARFILSTGRKEINILPLHHLGREKYSLAGKKYYTTDFKIPGKEDLQAIATRFESMGIICYIGSETPF